MLSRAGLGPGPETWKLNHTSQLSGQLAHAYHNKWKWQNFLLLKQFGRYYTLFHNLYSSFDHEILDCRYKFDLISFIFCDCDYASVHNCDKTFFMMEYSCHALVFWIPPVVILLNVVGGVIILWHIL